MYALWKQTQALPGQRAVQSAPPTAATHFIPPLNQLPNYHLTTPTLVYTSAEARKSLNSVRGRFWLALSTDWERHRRHVVFIFQLQDSHQLWNIWTEMLSEDLISHSLKCEQTWDNSWQRAWEEWGVLPSRPHWKGVGQGLSGIMFRMLSCFKNDFCTVN